MNHLNKLGFEFRNSHPAKGIEVATEALQLSQKLNFLKGEAEATAWLGSSKANLGQTDEALAYLRKSKALAQKLNNQWLMAVSMLGTGNIYSQQGKFPAAMDNFENARKIFEKINDKKFLASTYNNIGNTHNSQGHYAEGLENHLNALKLRIELNDKKGIAGSYHNTANSQKGLGNYQQALDNYEKALAINKELKNESWLANNYAAIALINYDLGVKPKLRANMRGQKKDSVYYFEQAIEKNQLALEIKEKLPNELANIANITHNIGLINVTLASAARKKGDNATAEKNLQEAFEAYKKVLKIREETNDEEGLAKIFCNIGYVKLELKKYSEARTWLDKSLSLSKKNANLPDLRLVYQALSVLDSLTNNYKGAYTNYRLYTSVNSQIENEENTKNAMQVQMDFDYGIKRAADSLKNAEDIRHEQLKHEQAIKQQKFYTYGGIIGFLLMIIVAAVSFRAYRQKQKTNSIISHQKELVEQKQKEVMDSIKYARRIQISFLPSEKYLAKKMEELKRK